MAFAKFNPCSPCCNFECNPSGCIHVYNPYTGTEEPNIPVAMFAGPFSFPDIYQYKKDLTKIPINPINLIVGSGVTDTSGNVCVPLSSKAVKSTYTFNHAIPASSVTFSPDNSPANNFPCGSSNTDAQTFASFGIGFPGCSNLFWGCESSICNGPEIRSFPYCDTTVTMSWGDNPAGQDTIGSFYFANGDSPSGIFLDDHGSIPIGSVSAGSATVCLVNLPHYQYSDVSNFYEPTRQYTKLNGLTQSFSISIPGIGTTYIGNCFSQTANLCSENNINFNYTTKTGCLMFGGFTLCDTCPEHPNINGNDPPTATFPMPETLTVTLGNHPANGNLVGQSFTLNRIDCGVVDAHGSVITYFAVIPGNGINYWHPYFYRDFLGDGGQWGCVQDMPARMTITLTISDAFIAQRQVAKGSISIINYWNAELLQFGYVCTDINGNTIGNVFDGTVDNPVEACHTPGAPQWFWKNFGVAFGYSNINLCLAPGPIPNDLYGTAEGDGQGEFDICSNTGVINIICDSIGDGTGAIVGIVTK